MQEHTGTSGALSNMFDYHKLKEDEVEYVGVATVDEVEIGSSSRSTAR
jgi:hypothetical protein